MPIVYIHGVNVRSDEHGKKLAGPLRRWIGPRLSIAGAPVEYLPVFWGDVAAKFRWDLASRPKTTLLRQGGAAAFAGLGALREAGTHTPLDDAAARPAPAATGPVLGAAQPAATGTPALARVPIDARADFLADLYLAARPRAADASADPIVSEPALAALADAAQAVALEWNAIGDAAQTESERVAYLMKAIDDRLAGIDDAGLLRQGGFRDWMTRAGEVMRRAAWWPADAVSTVFAELRPVANEFVTRFVGDVVTYLVQRDGPDGPGAIPQRVLAALRAAHAHKQQTGERIVVLTHSMGGQLFYDAINHYANGDQALQDIEVDHWISFGAQVSLFAELGMFKQQGPQAQPQKLPRPARVKAWTNYYDRNDMVGYIMSPVFDGVTDFEYDTGYGLAFAHTGYLARPSFFEAVAKQI